MWNSRDVVYVLNMNFVSTGNADALSSAETSDEPDGYYVAVAVVCSERVEGIAFGGMRSSLPLRLAPPIALTVNGDRVAFRGGAGNDDDPVPSSQPAADFGLQLRPAHSDDQLGTTM